MAYNHSILRAIFNTTRRKWRLVMLIVIGIPVFSLLLFHTVLRTQAQELNLLVVKYCELNIRQNEGIHKFALQSILKLSNLLPSIEMSPIDREQGKLGVYGDTIKSMPVWFIPEREVFVASKDEFKQALLSAAPGDVITFFPGTYLFDGSKIKFPKSGTKSKPIFIRAQEFGDVTLEFAIGEGFFLNKPNWVFENLKIHGVCEKDGMCQHAFHIFGGANNIIIRNNEIKNFNAHIKSNGHRVNKQSEWYYPDNVKIVNNSLFNEWKRNTKSPVTPIDVVGGKNWLVEGNFIADFGKFGRRGRGVTYGAYIKGGGANGMFKSNLVICEWQVPHTSSADIRIGLSFGGGGTANMYCPNKQCDYEHLSGTMTQNVILNCKNDVGIYLNKAKDTDLHNNIVIGSLGVDVRFPSSSANFVDNQIEGRISSRDGAEINTEN